MKATTLLTSLALSLTTTSALAMSKFDFAAIGTSGSTFETTAGTKNTGEGDWFALVGAGESIVVDGIELEAVGSNSTGVTARAFIDGPSSRKPGGLGVCSSYPAGCKTGDSGANTADDNLNRSVESLDIYFNTLVTINALTIRDANHDLPTGTFLIDGVVYNITTGVVDPLALALISPAEHFKINYIENGPELYISDVTVTSVPLPAAAWLFGSALFGLAGIARRSNHA